MAHGLSADIEGLALADGVLYASAQNVAAPRYNWVSRYNADNRRATSAVSASVTATSSDDCDQTDGIDAYAGDLGHELPERPVRLPGRIQRCAGNLGITELQVRLTRPGRRVNR